MSDEIHVVLQGVEYGERDAGPNELPICFDGLTLINERDDLNDSFHAFLRRVANNSYPAVIETFDTYRIVIDPAEIAALPDYDDDDFYLPEF